MSERSLYTGLGGNNDPTHHLTDDAGDGPLTGPDGQPLLALFGDLGDSLVSGTAPSGNADVTATSPISTSGSNLVINVTYDQPTSSLPSGFVAAINYVVSYYESLFTTATPTTVNIDVGYGTIAGESLDAGALGETLGFLEAYNYSTIKAALTAADPSAAATLPASQPVSGTMWLATADAKALGLSTGQSSSDLDGYVGFSAAYPFTYDSNNRAVAGKYDFIGVVEHEFSEVMGRIDLFNATLTDGVNDYPNAYTLYDMFHYTSQGVNTYTGTTTNYFSVDGGHTNLNYFNSNPFGDLGDWAASAGADAYLAFSPSGQANLVSQADITAMNALGYQSVLSPPVTIEALGSTALVEQGNFFFLEPVAGGTGPEVKMNGAPIGAGQVGGWSAIGGEATAAGYEMAWHLPSTNLYTVWNLDNSGNYLSDTIGAVAGTSATLENLETSFHQDLNGDGVTGIPSSITIESSGETALVQEGNFFFLDWIHSGTGPVVTMNDLPIGAGQVGGWTAIGAEQTDVGYFMAWHLPSTDLYTVWNLDSSGNYVSDTIGAVAGTSAILETLETSFQQDLNGDGTIGAPGTTIESFGATALFQQGDFFFLNPVASGIGPEVKMNGAPIGEGRVGGWAAIGAEYTGSGYEMAWHLPNTNLYTVWNLDSSGNYVSDTIGAVTGTSATLEAQETTFHQDLNGDGTIGTPGTTIESFGATALFQQGEFFFLNPVAGGSGPEVKMNGTPIGASQVGGWNAIGAEQITGGYEMAWHLPNTNLYTVWNLDSAGNYVSDTIGAVVGNSTTLEALETSFQQDLNGDGMVGVVTSAGAGAGTLVLTNGGLTSHDTVSDAPLIGLSDQPHHDLG